MPSPPRTMTVTDSILTMLAPQFVVQACSPAKNAQILQRLRECQAWTGDGSIGDATHDPGCLRTSPDLFPTFVTFVFALLELQDGSAELSERLFDQNHPKVLAALPTTI